MVFQRSWRAPYHSTNCSVGSTGGHYRSKIKHSAIKTYPILETHALTSKGQKRCFGSNTGGSFRMFIFGEVYLIFRLKKFNLNLDLGNTFSFLDYIAKEFMSTL